jgi:hypothetical protein
MVRRNFIYERYMLDAMKREALAPGAAVSAAERTAIADAKNVFEFDDRFIAPRFGYRDPRHLGFHGRGSRIPWHDRVTACWLARRFRLGPN